MAKEKTEEKTKTKKISEEEFEKKVIELADKGLTSEKIGEKLRKEGIHPKEYDKKISKILEENNKYTNPDLENLDNKLKGIIKHSEKNRQDKRAKRAKEIITGRLRRLKQYFNR